MVLPAQGEEWSPTWGMYQQILHQQSSFSQLSGWVPGHYEAMQDKEGTVRFYNLSIVTGDGFQVLGIKPHIGRLLEPYNDVRGGPSHGWSAVLSYGFWVERFGGDPAILGKPIQVGNTLVNGKTILGLLSLKREISLRILDDHPHCWGQWTGYTMVLR